MKRFLLWMMSVVPLVFVVSCRPAAQPELRDNPAPTPPPITAQGVTNPQEKDLPQLSDGPESTEREAHPVSNYILQRKYPRTLFLRADIRTNRVALTWDDGPDRRFTPKILDVLKKHNVKGTFFLMGARAKALPDITKRIEQEGHAIGNHTFWHANLTKGNVENMRWQVNETEKIFQNILGHRSHLFRAPYGNLNEELVRELGRMNYHVIGWSVDSLDWRQLSADEVERNVLGNVHPGSIILMHSGGNWNQDLSGGVQALDRIITKLKKDGIQFVTVPELLGIPR